jgi:hypothetical protein
MHESLFKKKGKDLRLIARQLVNGYHWQSFKGVNDDVFLVVATGAALDKIRSVNGGTKGGKKTEAEKAEMRAMKLYRVRRKELMWEYTAAAEKIFESVPLSALEAMNRWNYIGIDDRVPEEYEPAENAKVAIKADFARRALLWRMIMDCSSHYAREPLMDQLTDFQELIGVKPPKALLKQVEAWDAEIAAAAKVVAVETPVKKKGKK